MQWQGKARRLEVGIGKPRKRALKEQQCDDWSRREHDEMVEQAIKWWKE